MLTNNNYNVSGYDITKDIINTSASPDTVFNSLAITMVIALFILAAIMFIYAGVKFMTSTSIAQSEGRKILSNVTFGVLTIIFTYVVLQLANTNSLKFPTISSPLNTTTDSGSPRAPSLITIPNYENVNSFISRVNAGQNVCTNQTKSCGNLINNYKPMIDSIAGSDNKLISSLICSESSGNPNAVSSFGACGLTQVMPNQDVCGERSPGCNSLKDPRTAIIWGKKVLDCKRSKIVNNYNNVTRDQQALAAYNCCSDGTNPNAQSLDCNTNTGFNNPLPRFACPINPGQMLSVVNYVCQVTNSVNNY